MKKVICAIAVCLLCMVCAAAGADQLVLPKELTVIEEEAFCGAEALTQAVLPEAIEEIRARAFADSGLKQINLPSSLLLIADDAFEGCEGLVAFAQEGSYAYAYCEAHGIQIGMPARIERIALVTDGGTVDDESFNQACWEGVEEFAAEKGLAYQYYQPEADSDDERLASIGMAASDGADVIVLPGYLHGAAVGQAQALYPDVKFVGIDMTSGDLGADLLDNLFCATFREEQAGFLAGYAAVSDGFRTLGFLGGMAVPAVQRYGYGFVQGASAAAEALGVHIGINFNYAGQFFGDASLTEEMKAWYQSGVEVVFACGGGIWTSVAEAACGNQGYVIGVDVDQHAIGTQYSEIYGYNPFVTSAVKGLKEAAEYAIEKAYTGAWDQIGGTAGQMGLTEGDFVGLAGGSSWGFEHFSEGEYEAVRDLIRAGNLNVSDALSAPDVYSDVDVRYIHQGDAPLGESAVYPDGKMAILTGTTETGEEEYYAAQRAMTAYSADRVVHDTYPDKYYAEIAATKAKLIAFASDPDVRAIIACRAVQGVMSGFREVRTMYEC